MGVTSSKNKSATIDPSMCTCANLRRASRAITKIYDKILEPSKLKVTQYAALKRILQYGPLSVTKLAELLVLDRTTLVRNLKPLKYSGFIENSSTSDSRERAVAITEAGKTVVEAANHHWDSAQQLIRARLGEESIEQLGSLVTILEGFVVAGSAPGRGSID